MIGSAKLDQYKDKLENVKEVAGVMIAVVTIAAYIKKRVAQPAPVEGSMEWVPLGDQSQENNA